MFKRISPFPHYRQPDGKDCGPTCLRIVAKHYGKNIPLQHIRHLSETTREGSSLLGLSEAAEKMGFRTLGVKLSLDKLAQADLSCILHWNKNHFVVAAPSPSKGGGLFHKRKKTILISDPAHGLLTYTQEEFLKARIGNNATENTEEGIALLLEPTPKFYEETPPPSEGVGGRSDSLPFGGGRGEAFGFNMLSTYVFKYKRFLWQLIIGLLAGSLLQLIFPFLTQSIVDVGIRNQDIHFVYLILIAQLFLFMGRTGVEVIRSWIFLHLSTRWLFRSDHASDFGSNGVTLKDTTII